MSEFLGSAEVIVSPNTKAFRAELLAQLTAILEKPVTVLVAPSTKGFARKMRAELKVATEKPVSVLVTPDLQGFTTTLQREVRAAAKLVTASVLAVPAIGNFRAQLEAAVAAASKGVSVPVPVVPVLAPASKEVAKKAAAGTVAASTATRAARVKTAEEIAEAEEAAIVRAKQKTNAQLALLEEQRVARAIALDAKRVAFFEAAEAQQVAAAAAANAKAATEVAAFRAAERAALDTRLKGIKEEAKALQAQARVSAGPRIAEANALAAAQTKAAAATTALTEAEQFRSLASGAAAQARGALATATTAVAAAEASFEASLLTSNRALQGQAADSLLAARGLEVQREAAVRAAVANTELAASQEFVQRGALATLLSMAGLRGATLAANRSFIAGAAGAILLAKSIQSAASLESELNVFRVTAQATADEMTRVGEAASQLGRDVTLPGVSANDAAEAMTELSKAGLEVQDSIDGARGVLQLATAAQIDNAAATQLAASALNAFGLAGDEAVHVADVLTNAANAAQGSISDMGLSLQQAAAVSRQVGVSFEDTVALLTLLAQNGIRGSDAGTSLRVAFTKLINPTKKAKEILSDLNVTLRDAQGNIKPQVFSDFARAQADLSKKQQDANAAIVFGTDALRAYSIISREGIPAFEAVRDKLDRQGSAAELAGARMEGLEGKAENLKNQLSALGLSIGQNLLPPLEAVTDLLVAVTSTFNQVSDAANNLRDRLSASIPGGGFLSKFIAVNPLQQQIEGIKQLDDAIKDLQSGGGRFKIILDARDAVQDTRDLRAELNDILTTAAGLKKLDREVTLNQTLFKLDEMVKKLASGDANAQKLATSVRLIRREIAEAGSAGFEVTADLKLSRALQPAGLRQTGRDAAAEMTNGFIEEIERGTPGSKLFGIGQFLTQALANGIRSGKGDVENAAKETAGAAIKGFQGQQLGLEESFLDVELAGGGPQAQIRELKRQAAKQQQIIDAAGKTFTEARRKAKAKLQEINEKIASIEDEMERDAKKARDDAKKRRDDAQKARDDADAAFLDKLGVRSDKLGLRELEAQLSGNLRKQLALALARREFIRDEIALIQEHVKDSKKAAEEIRRLRGEQLRVDETIEQLRIDISQSVSGRLGQAINLAELRGDKSAMIVLLNAAIVEAKRAVVLAKAAKEGVLAAKIALQELINARRDAQQQAIDEMTDKFAKRIRLAELRGDKDAILVALDAAIANARKQVAKAKKAKKGILDAQIALEELIEQKEDFLDSAKDKGKGTTAFDLLTEAAERFTSTAGSLINADQPFAGPTGFTADMAQFLKGAAPSSSGGGGGGVIDTPAPPATKTDKQTQELITAIRANTDALLGRRGTKPKPSPEPAPVGDPKRRRARFVQSMEAHEAQIS